MPESRMLQVEREHFQVLKKLMPDLEGLVGERSFALLESGREVMMEMTCNPANYREGYAQRLLKHLNSVPASPRR